MHTAIDDRSSLLPDAHVREIKSLDAMRLIASLAAITERSPRSLSDSFECGLALDDFQTRWPGSLHRDLVARRKEWLQHKAASNPGTTLEPAWAAPLAAVRPLLDAFVDLSRSASLIGKLLPSAARVPFNVSVPAQLGGGTYRWVGQGAPAPVGNLQLSSVTLPVAKVSGILPETVELVQLTSPGSDATLRREMIRGMAQYLDQQFTDPTVAAVGGVSPASITNGAPSVGSAGSSSANVLTDLKALIDAFIAANPDAASMAILMSPSVAASVAIATNSTTLGPAGGRVFGIPVHTGTIGSRVVILDPSALLIADDGDMDVTIARHATLEMDTSATSPPTASTVLVSLWSLNLIALKITRFINWKMARNGAALYTNVSYV
jgi:capsid protein